jgi:hypothetical protein
MPKVHSTSFLTLSRFVEKYPSSEALSAFVGGNRIRPAMISFVANKIRTLLFFDSAIICVIFPRDILEPSMPNAIDIRVNLHDLLVIISAKLRTVYPNDPAIIICDAFKCKSGIACLTLHAIVVPGGTG